MEPSIKEYQTVVLAALLHDVGKLLQRGSFGSLDTKGKHPKVSADFVSIFVDSFQQVSNLSLLKVLVERHHESPNFPAELRVQEISEPYTRSLAYLVSLADNLSSSEREKGSGDWHDFKQTPMASVLQRVNQVGQLLLDFISSGVVAKYPETPRTFLLSYSPPISSSHVSAKTSGKASRCMSNLLQNTSLTYLNIQLLK